MADAPRAILLDAGGTLFRLRGTVGDAYAAVAARYGAQLTPEVLEQRFQAVFPHMPPLCFSGVPPSALLRLERRWWQRLVEQVIPPTEIKDYDGFFGAVFDYFAPGQAWELFPETIEVLDQLRQRRVRLAVVSNFDARLLRICDDLNISTRVDAVIASGRAGYAKPDPRIFHLALRRMGATPGQAIHVGDSEREDFEGARAAGVRGLLVQRAQATADTPGHVIRDLSQLLQLF